MIPLKISIVTPSYNQAEFIEATIRSVMHQDHDDVEHIVIDGGSTDGTTAVLKKYAHLHWVSEKDSGQSNAINKGFARATGDVVAWLNSDDYYEENVFGAVADYFRSHPDCMLLYGNITFVGRDGRPLYSITGDTIDYDALIACPDIVRQPSFFWRREVITEVGGVDENLHLVMDFDFLLRIGKKHRFHFVNRNLSYYRYYRDNKSLSQARRQTVEICRVYAKNGIGLNRRNARYLAGKVARTFVLGPAGSALRRLLGRPAETS
jgi:glycosyltransferase involved in cell wall biosynthesis